MEYVSTQVFVIALIVGLLLIGAEIFLPGGVLGVIAGLALITAIVAAFVSPIFTDKEALMIAIGIGVLALISVIMWMKFFPKTGVGGKMALQTDLKDAKAQEPGLETLIGKQGTTLTDLRPSGIAQIEGRRVDVITQGSMINKGQTISVIDVNANRVIVKPFIG